ncbi:hypothetical protein [Actinophytocola sp.]|uniref:hypothetical protein n=1 Tax=Actinophytocola sp. TaxID=1872138 RepID=UPI00389B39D9
MRLFTRASATIAAALVVVGTHASAAAVSSVGDPAAGLEGHEFSMPLTRDFSITDAQAARLACLLAQPDNIIVADASRPAAACR